MLCIRLHHTGFCIASTLVLAFILSACISPSQSMPATTQPPSASNTPLSIATQSLAFPLAGTWNGLAQNGSLAMRVTIILDSTCQVGAICGSYDLSLPCSGQFRLLGEQDGVYQFEAINKTAQCTGEGKDYLQLLSGGGLKYVSRGVYGETQGTLALTAVATVPADIADRIFVFVDDDGSPDGTTALLYLITQPSVDIVGAGISYGEAHPNEYIQYIGRLLDHYGLPTVPIGAGTDGTLSGGEGFPEGLRDAAAGFWGWQVPNPEENYPVQMDADLLIEVVGQSPEPVTLFFSGPLTNLALALRRAPEIRSNIAALYMMAGAINVPGNVADFYPDSPNVYAEWNVYSDPLAYKEVFESGLPMFLIPLDATNQVVISREDTTQWRRGGEISDFIADVYDGLMASTGKKTFAIWDLMASMIMVDNDLCEFEPVHLDVVTEEGARLGQTGVVDGVEPNANICLEPDVKGIKQQLIDQLSTTR